MNDCTDGYEVTGLRASVDACRCKSWYVTATCATVPLCQLALTMHITFQVLHNIIAPNNLV
jgi:hypothetical protein